MTPMNSKHADPTAGHSCCHGSSAHHDTPAATTALDPVCGMTIDPSDAAGSHEHDGTTYFFCSTHCLTKFKANPATFLGGVDHDHDHHAPTAKAPPAPGTAVDYTCPMHPEIVRQEPGSCPICGMALEC